LRQSSTRRFFEQGAGDSVGKAMLKPNSSEVSPAPSAFAAAPPALAAAPEAVAVGRVAAAEAVFFSAEELQGSDIITAADRRVGQPKGAPLRTKSGDTLTIPTQVVNVGEPQKKPEETVYSIETILKELQAIQNTG